ncbi:MAG: hypothetical protein R3B96_16215 [Pirellulaceae bacterium]
MAARQESRGGIAKISATLIAQGIYGEGLIVTRFHFSGDAFSARIALQVIELIQRSGVEQRCDQIGKQFQCDWWR